MPPKPKAKKPVVTKASTSLFEPITFDETTSSTFPLPDAPILDDLSPLDSSLFSTYFISLDQFSTIFSCSCTPCLFSADIDHSICNSLRSQHPFPDRISNFPLSFSSSIYNIFATLFTQLRTLSHDIPEQTYLWELIKEEKSAKSNFFRVRLFLDGQWSHVDVSGLIPVVLPTEYGEFRSFTDVPSEFYQFIIPLYPFIESLRVNQFWPVILAKALVKAVNYRISDFNSEFLTFLTGKICLSGTNISSLGFSVDEEITVDCDLFSKLALNLNTTHLCGIFGEFSIGKFYLPVSNLMNYSNNKGHFQLLRCHFPKMEGLSDLIDYFEIDQFYDGDFENFIGVSLFEKKQMFHQLSNGNQKELSDLICPSHIDLYLPINFLPKNFKFYSFLSNESLGSSIFNWSWKVNQSSNQFPISFCCLVPSDTDVTLFFYLQNLNSVENFNLGNYSDLLISISVINLSTFEQTTTQHIVENLKYLPLSVFSASDSLVVLTLNQCHYGCKFKIYSTIDSIDSVFNLDDFVHPMFKSFKINHGELQPINHSINFDYTLGQIFIPPNRDHSEILVNISHITDIDQPRIMDQSLSFPSDNQSSISYVIVDLDTSLVSASFFTKNFKLNLFPNKNGYSLSVNRSSASCLACGFFNVFVFGTELDDFNVTECQLFKLNDELLNAKSFVLKYSADVYYPFAFISECGSINQFDCQDTSSIHSYRPPTPLRRVLMSNCTLLYSPNPCCFQIEGISDHFYLNSPIDVTFELDNYIREITDSFKSGILNNDQSRFEKAKLLAESEFKYTQIVLEKAKDGKKSLVAREIDPGLVVDNVESLESINFDGNQHVIDEETARIDSFSSPSTELSLTNLVLSSIDDLNPPSIENYVSYSNVIRQSVEDHKEMVKVTSNSLSNCLKEKKKEVKSRGKK
ncbi:hypothetical protein P9112_004574 [Eukaryota sp. TZLM1-RC]